MAKCICCGTEVNGIICDSCRNKEDVEALCWKLTDYAQRNTDNELWNDIASEYTDLRDFAQTMIFSLTEDMEAPARDILRIHCLARNGSSVQKSDREWLLETVDACINAEATETAEKIYLMGVKLDALYNNYDFFTADSLAAELYSMKNWDVHTIYTLGEFYIRTRRYDRAKEILSDGITRFADRPESGNLKSKLEEAKARELGKENGGKVSYMPNPKENKETITEQYIEFLNSIGIVIKRKSKAPSTIPMGEYPKPAETKESGFKTFVAFDLETTGFSPAMDAITEIGAIRVVDGVISEEKKFIFQELVHPYKKKIPDDVIQKTGITNEMVKDAREIWEVFCDFADFIGDDILVGYNCMQFDSKFLARAGRHSNRIITNPYFDVMKMTRGIYGEKISLKEVSENLGIVNPQARRALADAVTTARVYLTLVEHCKNLP